MKKRLLHLFLTPTLSVCSVVGITTLLHAQPTVQWNKSLGGTNDDIAYAVARTDDYGYVVAGKVASIDGDVHAVTGGGSSWIAKLNPDGDTVWTRSIGGDGAKAVVQTSDGGYVVAGNAISSSIDMWVAKLNSDGGTVWTNSFGGGNEDGARSIIQTTDHGYIVAGYTLSNAGDGAGNHGLSDFLVIKLNSDGDRVWSRTLGGNYTDDAWSVTGTEDGGCVVAGETYSNDGDVQGNHDATHQYPDFWIVKLKSDGSADWTKTLGGSGYDQALSIVHASDGGYVVVGQTYSTDGDVHGNHGDADFWVTKLSSSGDTEWMRTLGGSGSDVASSIIQTTDGSYVVAGFTYSLTTQTDTSYVANGDVLGNHGQSDYWIVKLNSNGGTVWTKTLGGTLSDLAFSIVQTNDSPNLGYVVAGYASSNDGDVAGSGFHGIDDFWVVKLEGDKSPGPLLVSDDRNRLPANYRLSQNYPNPFNPSTSIHYEVPRATHVTLKIFDVLGRQAGTLVNQDRQAGSYNVEWDAGTIPSGVYFYRLSADNVAQTKKMVLMK